MTRVVGRAVAVASAATTFLLVLLMVALGSLTPPSRLPEDLPLTPFWLALPLYPLVMAGVGTLIAYRRPENAIGWLMCVTALLGALIELQLFYTNYSFAGGSFQLLSVEWVVLLSRCLWLPWVMLQLVYLPVLFPDGRPPSARWRSLLAAASATTVIAMAARALDVRSLADVHLPTPLGLADPGGRLHLFAEAASLMLLALATAALASVFVRQRRTSGDRRQQLKWFGLAIAFAVPVVVAGTLADEVFNPTFQINEMVVPTAFVCIPIAVAFAVLRYHLYDIELVINRTLVYGMLAAIIAAAYVAVVVGAGALVGTRTQLSWLPLLAAGGVALAFQPLRTQLERLANRLVYGRRASPYDALAALSRQTARMAPSQQLLADTLRAVCQAVGLPSASIWLRAGGEYRPVVQWPPAERREGAWHRPLVERGVAVFPVRDEGSELGVIAVKVPPGRSLSTADQRLLADIANHAGLLLRKLGMAADLVSRMAELRESRRRLVTAQDEARRRLERNLHDGAQQDLFSLKLGIRQVRSLLDREPAQIPQALERLEGEADAAWKTVKELARGVYPTLLTTQGIVAALAARARTAPVAVRISRAGVRRYPPDVEEAVYYTCSEALQNAVQHSQATTVQISLVERQGVLRFRVQDDGRGFNVAETTGSGLQGMRDRLDVAGGSLELRSRPGGGCEVRGRLRVAAASPADHGVTGTEGESASGRGASGPAEAKVERGHREEVEESARDQPAEDHDRERVLDLVPGPIAENYQRHDTEPGR
jgi:signal transduction histidine kinase